MKFNVNFSYPKLFALLLFNYIKFNEAQGVGSYDKYDGKIFKELNERFLTKRGTMKDRSRLWEEGVIPFSMREEVREEMRQLIYSAMHEWESKTCIRFVPDNPLHQYSIQVVTEGACGSCCTTIGSASKERPLVLVYEKCRHYSIVLHELGHTIGFYHEQNRPDRDEYVKIMFENIREGLESSYAKNTEDEVDSLGYSYDYKSIMHYGSTTMGKPGKRTMMALNESVDLLYRNEHLSEIDIAQTRDLYKCPKCLLNIYEIEGTISATNESPMSEEYCHWYIKRNFGETITLTLEYLDIPESEGCSTDYLEIRDGYWSKSPLIGRFCGNVSENSYKTSTNHALIIFKKINKSSDFKGFSLKYSTNCGGKQEGDKGKLESVTLIDDPSSYRCNWTIAVPSGYKVALHFKFIKINGNGNCEYNYIEVREGKNSDGELLEKFCESRSSVDLLSSSNVVNINEASSKRISGVGFSVSFIKEINECESSNGGCSHICVNSIGSYYCKCENRQNLLPDKKTCGNVYNECGGFFNLTEEITIASPSFPDVYPVNMKCTWEFANENIQFTFIHMDVEKRGRKCSDKVIINSSDFSKRTFCGRRKPESFNVTNANNLEIKFISDRSIRKTGFSVVVQPLP